MALFPPGKGGGEEIAYGGKGKGVLIHTLTEGNGMPLANSTTPANGNEREQVLPLLDKVKLRTLKRGRPRKKLQVWLLIKVTIQRKNVLPYVNEAFGPKYQNGFGKPRKTEVDLLKSLFPDISKNVVLLGINVNIVA
nr:hypothetical protein [Nostoc sp. MG11]